MHTPTLFNTYKEKIEKKILSGILFFKLKPTKSGENMNNSD